MSSLPNSSLRNCLLILLSAFLVSCGDSEAPVPAASPEAATTDVSVTSEQQIDAFFTAFTDRWMENNPNSAVSTGYFDADTQDVLEQQLTPWTIDYKQDTIALAREGLAQLAQLDLAAGTPEQQLSGQLMRYMLEARVDAGPFLDYIDFPLNQLEGANVGLVTAFTQQHPFINATDVENYVTRLRGVDERMQEATAESARRFELGSNLPRFILNSTITQMRGFVADAPEDNPYITTLVEKSAGVTGLEETRRQQLIAEATEILTSEIYPAWNAATVQLQAQLATATDEAGVSRFANGAEIYQNRLTYYTTTDMTAAEIHETGLNLVSSIEAEMEGLFDQIGIREGSINERVNVLRARLSYPDSDAGRAELSRDIEGWVADALARAPDLFDTVPKTEVIPQALPEFLWDSRSASYSAAPLNGSRPALYLYPLRTNELTAFRKRSTVYHETVPGHHFQIARIGENTNLPRFMQMRAYGSLSASTEGWALYAERLVAENGWYDGDIEGQLGQLDSALFRARRLVVDTGLHTMGWTRQQAIDYGLAPSEVDRYIVRPGQATSYMIGQLKIVELRERARAALGEDFSIQEFHNTVLGAGVVALSMLETIVDDFVAEKQTQ